MCRENEGKTPQWERCPSLPSYGSTAQLGPWSPPLRFLNHTELDTHGRTPLDE
jgi:hypothetical protein